MFKEFPLIVEEEKPHYMDEGDVDYNDNFSTYTEQTLRYLQGT